MSLPYKTRINKRKGYWLVKVIHRKTGLVVKPMPVDSLPKAIALAILTPFVYKPKNWGNY